MRFEIYTADMSNRHELTHAISVFIKRHYNDIGKFQMVVVADDYNINAVQVNGVIYDVESGETYIIEDVEYNSTENQITINGYTANWVLNKRVIASTKTGTNVESTVLSTVSDNLRSLPRVSVALASGLAATADISLYGGQLLDTLIPILDDAEYGHKMVWDPDSLKWTFTVYQGEDLTSGMHAVVFSEERGTAADLIVTDDNSTYKSTAYMPVTYNDDSTGLIIQNDSYSGGDRYEYWYDNKSKQKSSEEKSDYLTRIRTAANEKLAARLHRTNFEVNIDASDFGTAYNLGDKIACSSVKFNVQFTARITGVTYRLDATGTETTLTLGEPTITALEELKINNG